MIDANYQDVGDTTSLAPGEMIRVLLDETWVLVANVQGLFYAVSDTCTHEDASLSLGALVGDYVSCPLHGSRFCLRNGQAIDEPADTNLVTYPTKVEKNRILICISTDH